jgi:PPOX class probable F420-dependent enzyme
METATLATTRIHGLLEREPVVWLSTVRPDGGPHLIPTWFSWDGEALLIFSKPGARKVRNLRANASVMLALGDAEDDFDVGLIEARAELLDRPTSEVLPPAHLAKYAGQLRAIGLSAADYATTYSQAIRVVPLGFLPWHGRTTPWSVRLAGAPAFSIGEPRHPGTTDGEPLARRTPLPRRPFVEPARRARSLREWLGEPLAGVLPRLTPRRIGSNAPAL